MALAGEGAICIWNDITPAGRAEFYAWHLNEHMPERAAIPGFLRGRRYIAVAGETSPEFFTLYEATTYEVLVGPSYLARLNDPTPWTKTATAAFRNTSRALTHVAASLGPGPGGALATVRFAVRPEQEDSLLRALAEGALNGIVAQPLVTGAHLCRTDPDASAAKTAETRDRKDILAAPDWVALIEGCGLDAVRAAASAMLALPAFAGADDPITGLYQLEYTRLKTPASPG